MQVTIANPGATNGASFDTLTTGATNAGATNAATNAASTNSIGADQINASSTQGSDQQKLLKEIEALLAQMLSSSNPTSGGTGSSGNSSPSNNAAFQPWTLPTFGGGGGGGTGGGGGYMPVSYSPSVGSGGGGSTGGGSYNPAGLDNSAAFNGLNNLPAGSANARIAAAAQNMYGASSAAGPDGGVEACDYMVNKVLNAAGIGSIGANPLYVPSTLQALENGAGTQVSAADAKPGDIAIAGNDGHIGIVMGNGASCILSNSSSQASFDWKDTGSGWNQYFGGQTTYWRVNK